MDVSALNLATIGAGPDEGALAAPGGAATDGAVFAKLLMGLGIAAPVAAVDPVAPVDLPSADGGRADGEAPPVDPAVLLAAAPLAAALPRGATAEPGTSPLPAAPDERETAADGETPTPASLGLPPLLAALVAPTLAQAAPVPAAPVSPEASATSNPQAPRLSAATPPLAGGPSAVTVQVPPAGTPSLPGAAPDAAAPAAAVPAATAPAAAVPMGDRPTALSAVAPPVAAPLPSAGKVPLTPGAGSPSARSPEAPADMPAATAPAAAVAIAAQSPVAAPPAPRRAPAMVAGPSADRSPPERKPVSIVDRAAPLASVSLPVAPAPMAIADLAAPAPAAAPVEAAPTAELLVEHQLDMAREGEWLDQLTRDIVRTASAEGSLRFRLNPEHLGSLHVEVTQGQGGASVRLTADTEQARSLIAEARPQLIAEARAQGVRIAEAHVDLGGQGQAPQSQAGNGGRGGRELPTQEYLTSWQPESAEEEATPSQRSAAERYA